MDDLLLIHSTGDERIDRFLQGLVGIYMQTFPGRIRSFYLTGSYADGSSISLSDIDLSIVFAGTISDQEAERARALEQFCEQLGSLRLNLSFSGEASLSDVERVLVKRGGMLIYGKDIREHILLPTLDVYRKHVTWMPYRFWGQVIRSCEVLSYPLTYPNYEDEFYGYTQKRISVWYPAEIEQGTKELITGALRTATAILALRAGQYVMSKRDSVQRYRAYIHDEWTNYLETLYFKGKLEWQYLIPAEPEARRLLHELCQRTLAFENQYFELYRKYLLTLLQGSEDDTLFVLERLTQVIFADEEVIGTVQALESSAIDSIRRAACQTRKCIEREVNQS